MSREGREAGEVEGDSQFATLARDAFSVLLRVLRATRSESYGINPVEECP